MLLMLSTAYTNRNQKSVCKYIYQNGFAMIMVTKRSVALCYYTQNKISLGYCEQIAEMTKESFIRYLGENGISIFQFDDEQEFMEEMKNA
jgi:predicted HTH domain antitoxin